MTEPESRSMQKRKAAQRGEPMPTFGTEPAYSAEDLRIAKELGQRIVARYLQGIYPSIEACCENLLPAEFAAVRRERDQAAEKLAEALRIAARFGPVGGEACLACDNDGEKHQPNCPWGKVQAALAEWERSAHEGE